MVGIVILVVISILYAVLSHNAEKRVAEEESIRQDEMYRKAVELIIRRGLLEQSRKYPHALDYYCALITSDRLKKFDIDRLTSDEAETLYDYRNLFMDKETELNPLYAWQRNQAEKEEREKREADRRKQVQEKRQTEINRRNTLKKKFHYFRLGGYNAAYLFDYCPKNRFPSVESTHEMNRRKIWDFKDGNSALFAKQFAEFLDGNFSEPEIRNKVLCVIPASTDRENTLRYFNFCNKVCEITHIQNGYKLISIVWDRQAGHIAGKSSDTTSNLEFSSSVYGKDIILVDDLTTSGASFIQAANALKVKGAKSVYGFFFGKTVGYF